VEAGLRSAGGVGETQKIIDAIDRLLAEAEQLKELKRTSGWPATMAWEQLWSSWIRSTKDLLMARRTSLPSAMSGASSTS
jgi:hypothetical protein